MSSFSIPLSGLQAESSWLGVISNNLANLDTVGFKDQGLSFGDIFGQMQGMSGNGDPIQIGQGVQIAGQSANFSDGGVQSTGVASNMALQGNGFFVVQNGNGLQSYTRAGDFSVNSQGQLTTPSGELVMGYPAVGGVVSPTGALGPITVNQTGVIPGTPTTTFSTTTNLNSSSAVGTTFSSPITVYDSQGTPQTLNIQYTNTAANAWSYKITLPGPATGGAAGTTTTVATGTMTFNSSGQLTSPTGSVAGINITGLADGAANMSLSWNLAGSGGGAITQLDTASATSANSQNGFGVGNLVGYSVTSNGTIQGQFSNGQTQALGQVAVANFSNNQGLQQSNNGDYQSTFASGAANVGQAGSGGNGSIQGGAVEMSNVDLSAEFSNMIVAQQGYEANAKALTTLNQINQATIQMIS